MSQFDFIIFWTNWYPSQYVAVKKTVSESIFSDFVFGSSSFEPSSSSTFSFVSNNFLIGYFFSRNSFTCRLVCFS